MANGGRRPVLDNGKRREILALLTVGCSRRTAARYVGCAVSTIQNTAARDGEFAEQLRHALYNAEIGYLKNIQKAAKKEQYWRAAAWALERMNPAQFGPPAAAHLTPEKVDALLDELVGIVVEELPAAMRKQVLKRIEGVLAKLRGPTPREGGDER